MIPPALTPAQWADIQKYGVSYMRAEAGPVTLWNGNDGPAAILAVANAALPDGDPRKITHEWIMALGVAQTEVRKAFGVDCIIGPCEDCLTACERFCARLQSIADALASYLPPRA